MTDSPERSRYYVHNHRPREVRARTVSTRRMSQGTIELGNILWPERDYWRPRTRGDCARVKRPCPFVGCRWNLYLDVMPETQAIKFNFPDLEPWEMDESCALDIADRGEATLEKCGQVMNLVRERIRMIQRDACRKVNGFARIVAGDSVPFEVDDPHDSGTGWDDLDAWCVPDPGEVMR